jgi:hypothetical protein
MLASHALRPITSVRIRKRAVASAFESPAYSLRLSCSYAVVQVAGGFRSIRLYLTSSHLAFQSFVAIFLKHISFGGGAHRRRLPRCSCAVRMRSRSFSIVSRAMSRAWFLASCGISIRRCLVPRRLLQTLSAVASILLSTGSRTVRIDFALVALSAAISSGETHASLSRAARGVLLYPPVILLRHLF